MQKLALLLLLTLSLPSWADKTVKIGEITWYTSYQEALAKARELRRPLWLHFGENPG